MPKDEHRAIFPAGRDYRGPSYRHVVGWRFRNHPTFTLKNAATGVAVAASVTRNGTTNQWILNPATTLAASTRYTATISGGPTAVRDVAGTPLASTAWSFTTGTR